MHIAYLLTGSNLGQPQHMLEEACRAIEEQGIGIILNSSSLYRTAAWGLHHQPDFLNQVLKISTVLAPDTLLNRLLDIEQQMGRIRLEKNGPRVIDIDILFYDDTVVQTPRLTIPHPLMQERRFVLVPLNELAPTLLHPVLHKTVNQLLDACADPLHVNKFSEAG